MLIEQGANFNVHEWTTVCEVGRYLCAFHIKIKNKTGTFSLTLLLWNKEQKQQQSFLRWVTNYCKVGLVMGQSDCTHTHSSILNRQSVWRRELGTLPQECAPSLLSVKLHTHTHTSLGLARRGTPQCISSHVRTRAQNRSACRLKLVSPGNVFFTIKW